MIHFLRIDKCVECDCVRKCKSKTDACIEKACRIIGVTKLFPEQDEALKAFINKKDVLLNLPAGCGKSLVFQMALLVQFVMMVCCQSHCHSDFFIS